jgi:hypothetical protein
LEEGVDPQTLDEVLDLLVQITDDRWWSRAWIFQEDYLAGTKLWLLIRHAQGLDKKDAEDVLENLAGELVIKSNAFKKYLTLFCLALKDDQRPFVRNTCAKLLQKAGKYNVLHNYRSSEYDFQRTITINILKDLNTRDMKFPRDFLPITANICGYDNRILATKNKILKMSLSLGILTLYICNGELFRNDCEEIAPYVNVFDFLENLAMPIHAPLPDGELTFMKHCRFSVDRLSPAGVHTKGIIWKLSDAIRPDRLQPQRSLSNRKDRSQKDVYRHGLDGYQRSRLFDLVRVLSEPNKRSYKCLANDLETYLENHERSSRRDDWSTKNAIDVMAACIVNGMDNGKYLQVARLVKKPPGGGLSIPCRAIFVRDHNEMQRPGPTYVFTSWSRTKDWVGEKVECKTLAKYVSMEVSFDEMAQHGVPSLRSQRWINGLCFFDGEMKSQVIFAWPDSLCK